MPALPAWFSRLDAILSTLRNLEPQQLDRRAIENLFHVKPRRAQQLMMKLAPSVAIGKNLVVSRDALIESLGALARGEEVATFHARQKRAAEEIARAQAESAARQIPIVAAPDRFRRRFEDLPETVALAPGHLEIRFRDINDLWRQLSELAAVATSDRDRFREAAHPNRDAAGI